MCWAGVDSEGDVVECVGDCGVEGMVVGCVVGFKAVVELSVAGCMDVVLNGLEVEFEAG